MESTPEALTSDAPPLPGRTWFHNEWRTLTLLHWAYEPAVVQALLPEGLTVDTFEGQAWVGLVPFVMGRVRPVGTPAIAWFSTFCETNVRTYAFDQRGRRGVHFFSLDAARLGVVLAARLAYGVPYCWSRMRIDQHADVVRYNARRRWPEPRGAKSTVEVRIGEPMPGAEEEPLLRFLTARWSALSGAHWTHRQSPSGWTPIAHPRWSFRAAELLAVDDGLVTAAGLPAPDGDPLVHHADLTIARIGRPQA